MNGGSYVARGANVALGANVARVVKVAWKANVAQGEMCLGGLDGLNVAGSKCYLPDFKP